jgi:hypothetical protein
MTVVVRRSRRNPSAVNAEYGEIARLEQRRRIRLALWAAVIVGVVVAC